MCFQVSRFLLLIFLFLDSSTGGASSRYPKPASCSCLRSFLLSLLFAIDVSTSAPYWTRLWPCSAPNAKGFYQGLYALSVSSSKSGYCARPVRNLRAENCVQHGVQNAIPSYAVDSPNNRQDRKNQPRPPRELIVKLIKN